MIQLHIVLQPSPTAFPCHENGATVLQYASKQQLLITGGRKGFVCVFDIRQRQLLHTFQAHDSAIKALALDAFEDFFVTGSAEGNMKVLHHSLTGLRKHICSHTLIVYRGLMSYSRFRPT